MNYPFWDVPLGYGILMGGIAVVHVFISHFAIGGGLYLVVTERTARACNDEATLAFLRTLSKFFARLTLVAGALTGVGIWFIIGLLAPVATEALIHNYVWGWATEWTFFLVEIAAALLYYYGWARMSARAHLTIGWIYFGAAWLSLFIINGILTFMLTPGQWLASGSFWDGFFNPTFWPSLVLRTGVCLILASLYALLVAARSEAGALKTRTVRSLTTWGLAHLPFARGAFGAVTCSHAFYELKGETQDRALKEVLRVLKPKGTFLMMEHDVPPNPFLRALFYLRLAVVGAGRAVVLLRREREILEGHFGSVEKVAAGRSKVMICHK